jgi:transposase
VLFVGDDWAEDHHDVELQDQAGRRLRTARLPEGVAGLARMHALIAEHVGDGEPDQVWIGIETDRGPWVHALVAAGYRVYAINPRQAARFRERYATSGAKSDTGDAHALADMVRTDAHQLRLVAGDSPLAGGIKALARAHQNLIWDRTRHVQRLRAVLREYFPAALEAFDDFTAIDALELLAKAPDPVSAARLSRAQIATALKHARRHNIDAKTEALRAVLRSEQLTQPGELVSAFAAITRCLTVVITVLNGQIDRLYAEANQHVDRHPTAKIYRSQPGLAKVLSVRVLGEFGDDPDRYASAKARKNYAGTSPVTRQSGKKKIVQARFVHNDRLVDALQRQAQGALSGSVGARVYYDLQRARGANHQSALRQLANRLVGILHGCLKTGTLYDESAAWPPTPDGEPTERRPACAGTGPSSAGAA